jgi:hypothetical protein
MIFGASTGRGYRLRGAAREFDDIVVMQRMSSTSG